MNIQHHAAIAALGCGLVGLASAQNLGAQSTKPPAPPITNAPENGPCAQVGATLCIALDNTFQVVDFGNGVGACERNDDGSGWYDLNGWSFDHFGTAFPDLYINNNGNISFGQPYSAYSPFGFPISGFPMVAPFWGDVDTRATAAGGAVWVKEWSIAGGDSVNRLCVTWDNVGYFSQQTNLLNTFQVIISDGNDPLVGLGNNVCFCYDDMQWTTGSASGGVGGFGGSPATVGANEGNGVDFFQIGTFDHAGSDYDGPGGAADGVSWLDGATFCFDISGLNPNTPPVFLNPPGCPLDVAVGGVLNFQIQAIGPELGETVDIVVDSFGIPGFSSIVTPGNPAVANCTFSPTMVGQVGLNPIQFTATDDGTPALSTIVTIDIEVALGPDIGATYCTSEPNSTGLMGHLQIAGSNVAADDMVQLRAFDLPPGQFVLFLGGPNPTNVLHPGGYDGVLCIGSPHARFKYQIQQATACGRASIIVDTTNVSTHPPQPILGGQTWHFQAWHRDTVGSGANFTDAASAGFL